MPQQPIRIEGLSAGNVQVNIELLVDNLFSIKDETGQFLLRLPDGRVIDTKGWNDWEWTHGIGLYGLWQYHTLTNSPKALQIINDWYTAQLATGTTKNINTMSVMLTLACLYEKTQDQTYLPWLDSWAEWAMYDLPRTRFGGMQHITYLDANKQELWDDTLMMTVLPLAKIGKVLNRPQYIEEAKFQFLLHIRYLCDPSTGLFFHGWKFDSSAAGGVGHHFAKARWARGNAWLTIAIPEFIELLDLAPGDALREHLLATLVSQCEALRALQDRSGCWRTLLDVSEIEGSYVEASATAGIAYGMLKAARKRYISKEFKAVAWAAVHAVFQRIDVDGELKDVSFGTAMGHDLQHYKDIPVTSMPYGQAMAMMMLVEVMRKFH
ncbi:unnamed protein product [Zymoseptoria tritici ST99CH_1E4]|uniref:Glycosyl hydrolase family 88 n=1 Tax=Zymoseptoria tritici ST99CH_1E4 TaxID=1276532 RepID=A0A2H1H498_ZYMTR|nr:unnamed protein product [Zymoseptoria tritici ST99CH_1E4]